MQGLIDQSQSETVRNWVAVVWLAVWLPLDASVLYAQQQVTKDPVDFASQVKPILSDNCFFCHGPDAEQRHAELRMDQPPQLQEREPAMVAGDREASLVWQRINDSEQPMPPVESHKSLTRQEIAILGRWIDQGAQYETHWAYAPITAPKIPPADDAGGSRGVVDQFLLQKMQQQGLKPSPAATPNRLIRRVYLDVIGLPPGPEQLARFLENPTPDAYNDLIDDLFDSPRFGEHWASWWLDLVRYGDSAGFHGDQARSVWPYRDWVIGALNNNMPFDEFTSMQLAGDLMQREPTVDQLVASAYNRIGPSTAEGGAQQAEYLTIYAADRVANFGEVWLASSTGCARCHDHKYDPFTATDFYSLAAIFADIDEPIISERGRNPHWAPFLLLPENEAQSQQVSEVDDDYEKLLSTHATAGAFESWHGSRDAGPAPSTGEWKQSLEQLINKRNELAKTIPLVSVTRALPQPRTVRLLSRGNWLDESGPVMQPRPPEFLRGQVGDKLRVSRLDLANWLFEHDNPLTARVVVNRLWDRFFGRGLSSNTLDLGNQGQPPTHRELLDWLAVEFRDSGWDLRHVMRLMLMSRAYQQSAAQPASLVDTDPENKWFARQTATRLPAEVLRDQALAVSGLLVHKAGGPGVYPYQPDRHWDALNFPKRSYPQSQGDDLYRRSVYMWVQRTFPHPTMTTFDAPNRESCIADRPTSNTPLQALTLLNETLYVEAARKLAQRSMLAQSDHDQRVDTMFQLALLRPVEEFERQKLKQLYESQRQFFASHPTDAAKLCSVGQSKPSDLLPPAELAAYTSIGRVILNLHELQTRP